MKHHMSGSSAQQAQGFCAAIRRNLWRARTLRARWSERFWQWALDTALRHHPSARNSRLVSYAETELRLAGWYDEDAFYGDLVPKAVLRSVRLFSTEGHSGMSAGLVSNLTSRVCMFKPLSPLTGEDDEWRPLGDGGFQNKRMASIFKRDGRAYWSEGRVFRDANGLTFTSLGSRVEITFPWTPTDPEIVDVPADAQETP